MRSMSMRPPSSWLRPPLPSAYLVLRTQAGRCQGHAHTCRRRPGAGFIVSSQFLQRALEDRCQRSSPQQLHSRRVSTAPETRAAVDPAALHSPFSCALAWLRSSVAYVVCSRAELCRRPHSLSVAFVVQFTKNSAVSMGCNSSTPPKGQQGTDMSKIPSRRRLSMATGGAPPDESKGGGTSGAGACFSHTR